MTSSDTRVGSASITCECTSTSLRHETILFLSISVDTRQERLWLLYAIHDFLWQDCEGFFFPQFFPQSRSTETCGGQRGREDDDCGGHKGTYREKRKDITGNRENEPGAEKR